MSDVTLWEILEESVVRAEQYGNALGCAEKNYKKIIFLQALTCD